MHVLHVAGDPAPAPDAAGRLLTCAFSVSGPGFTVLDVTVSSSRSPRVRGVADILLARPSPPAVMIRSGHSGEVYVGDAVHLTAGGLGFAEETWCVTVIGDDELKSPAHRVSAAAVTCEVPSTRDDEDRALLDATMDACAAHACGLSTGKAAPTRDAGHLVLGAGESSDGCGTDARFDGGRHGAETSSRRCFDRRRASVFRVPRRYRRADLCLHVGDRGDDGDRVRGRRDTRRARRRFRREREKA